MLKIKKYLNILLFILLINFSSYAIDATQIDSLNITGVNSEKQRVEALLILSDEFKNNNSDKALEFAEKAYYLSKNNNYEEGELNSMLSISQIYWSLSDYNMAMGYAEKAKELAENVDSKIFLAKALRVSGMIYIDLHNYTKSSEYFFKSLKIYEELNNKLGIEQALGDIGSVNFHQLNFDKALEYFNRSLEMAKKQKNKKGMARGFNNIAAVYEALGDYKQAVKYFEKANIINKKLGNKQREAINNINLGVTYLNLHDFEKSFFYFKQADSLFLDINNINMQVKCWIGFANYYFAIHSENQGIKYANDALIKAQELNNNNLIYDATDILHKIYLSKNDISNAYKYFKLESQIKDSLNLTENRINLSKLELEYKFEKKEQKVKLKQQKIRLYISLIIISLLIIIIIIILILVNQRIKTKNALLEQQNLEHELEITNKEMTTNVMSLMKKNEMLSILSNKLVELKNKTVNKEVKQAVNKIAIELQKTADPEIYKEFEYRFNQIHVGFYDSLLKKYPKLTPGELRLCAFLRLNMSTKEISELTGQVPSSLETARYRLRKKLGISNTKENLITFLTKI